jgi:hypothetical protein
VLEIGDLAESAQEVVEAELQIGHDA